MFLDAAGEAQAGAPIGYGSLDGAGGAVHPIDSTIMDDPVAAPGSGADRLRYDEAGARLRALWWCE